MLDYENFDILIGHWDGKCYPTRVLASPSGETQGTLSIQALAPDVMANLKALHDLVASIDTAQSQAERASQANRLGELLFDALMSGEVRSCFDVSQMLARNADKGIRIRLRIEPPTLTTVPWELMRDRRHGQSLSLSSYSPVVRYLEIQRPASPLVISSPMRILVVIASPRDQPPLEVEAEQTQLLRALDTLVKMGAVEIVVLPSADLLTIQRKLRADAFHVLHYIGHGFFQPEDAQGYLIFEDSDGMSQLVSGRRFAQLLKDETTLRLVLLNACSTALNSETGPFTGVAACLVQAAIPAVVAMQTRITDQAALRFAQVFYEALADGAPIDTAVSNGRMAVYLSSNDTVEWAIPQLYMRTGNGCIFEFRPANTSGAAFNRSSPISTPPKGPVRTQPQHYTSADTIRPNESLAFGRDVGAHGMRPRADTVAPHESLAVGSRAVDIPPVPASASRESSTRYHAPTADRPSTQEGMQVIPAGTFIFGVAETRDLPEFYLDTTPVTNADFARYIQATRSNPPVSWQRGRMPDEKADHPVTGVSYFEAEAYARWIGKRLPTAEEWEKGARSADGRHYPWGNTFQTECCNTIERGIKGTCSVFQHQAGISPYGVLDMVGNVAEWTTTEMKPRGLGRTGSLRVLKGGSWNSLKEAAACNRYSTAWPDERPAHVGFRCAYSREESADTGS